MNWFFSLRKTRHYNTVSKSAERPQSKEVCLIDDSDKYDNAIHGLWDLLQRKGMNVECAGRYLVRPRS
jgi:hypothetical protein